jgi:hypothetical protein
VLVWSTIGTALAPAVLAFTRDAPVAAAIAGFGAIFTAGVNLALFDRMMSIVPKGYGVTFTSVDTMVVFLAGILGPLIAATIADSVGLAWALVVASIATLSGALLFAVDRVPWPSRARAVPAAVTVSSVGPEKPVG